MGIGQGFLEGRITNAWLAKMTMSSNSQPAAAANSPSHFSKIGGGFTKPKGISYNLEVKIIHFNLNLNFLKILVFLQQFYSFILSSFFRL